MFSLCTWIYILLPISYGFPSFQNIFWRHDVAEESLVLVHVLFRHGNRTSNLHERYPKDTYLNETYYPFGSGQLTNEGKRTEYNIGTALRQRYHKFLGQYYYPEILEARSTDYNRTKMSLVLVLAGLFPPEGVEVWKFDLNWQPIPYNYAPADKDKVLIGIDCPNYKKMYYELTNSMKYKEEVKQYQDVISYISEHSGNNVTTFGQIYNLFFGLTTEEEWGFKLPKWTEKVWPKTITSLAIKEYFVQTATEELTSMANGYFMKKILDDSELKIRNHADKYGKKVYLYSAHENNIADLLIYLGLFKEPHIPPYGAYLIFEIHSINNTHGMKIFYQRYEAKNPRLLKLPNCEEFCPLSRFTTLYKEHFPSEELCGMTESLKES